MKVSDVIEFLSNLPTEHDPEIVTGEDWLPEQLIKAHFDGEMVNFTFDNAPEENSGDIEGRGFVDHEVDMLKDKLSQLITNPELSEQQKVEIILNLFVLIHEQSSTDVIETVKNPSCWQP